MSRADDLRYLAARRESYLRRAGHADLADLLDQLISQGGRDCDTVRGRMAALPAVLMLADETLEADSRADRAAMLDRLRGCA